jgi:uncharacterized protein YkwD
MLRRRLLVSSFALLTAVIVLHTGTSFAGRKGSRGACAGARTVPVDAKSQRRTARAVLCLVNRSRRAYGLQRVRRSGALRLAAARHGIDMVRNKYFSHVGRDGGTIGTRVRRTGYLRMHRVVAVSETLAWAPLGSATTLVRALLHSPGHRSIVLDPAQRHIGIGLVRGAPIAGAGTAATLVLAFGV